MMVDAVRAERERGAVFAGASPEPVATILGAVGDGLLLHVLLGPELDAVAAIDALRALLGNPGSRRRPGSSARNQRDTARSGE
jgi:hypothetical protein